MAAVLLASCTQPLRQEATQLTAVSGKSFRLTSTAEVPLASGTSTTLRSNSRWELVGGIPQGEVYRTRDHVVTVRGEHIYEGYIVVKDGTLVGFYLPVERTFSPVTPGQPLTMEP